MGRKCDTGYYNGIETKDLTEELKQYFIAPDNQGVYFLTKCFIKQRITIVLWILYTGDANSVTEDNEKNYFFDFLQTRDSALVEHIYSQKLKPSYMYEHFTFLHYYGML